MKNCKISLSFLTISSLAFSLFLSSKSLAQNNDQQLDPIIVTANPLGKSLNSFTQPVTILENRDLLYKIQPTIGETLSSEVGIRSTYFGPNASRPVIRGLEGNQITILQNGVSNIDASAVSVDHNVAIDPLTVKKIEIIRGPSALLYGSKAVGGVINIINNRIPNKPISNIITGNTDIRYNSANNEKSGSAVLEGGFGSYAWHINGFSRSTDNVEIPSFAREKNLRQSEPLASNENEIKNKLQNSQSDSKGGSVGVSKFFDNGYFGASLTSYDSDYGVVAEPDVTIDMKQQRFDIAGQYNKSANYLKEVNYKFGVSDYEHTEFEGVNIGTVFKNRGYDSRIELIHEKLGILGGVIGVQSARNEFSASGEEAYLPSSTTQNNSIFILEEVDLDKITLQVGGRAEYQNIDVDKDVDYISSNSRDDLTGSGSIGFVYDFTDEYSSAFSLSYTQRAPNSQELYSKGNHIATGSYEIGNENLDIQKSHGVDISFKKKSDNLSGEVNLFYNRFQDFITLLRASGSDPESGFPIYNFVNLPAEFFGAEFKSNFLAFDNNSHKINVEFRGDYVEARNKKTGEPLPRISPARVGASIIYDYQKIGFKLDGDYNFAKNHISQYETKTDGYLMLNAITSYNLDIGKTSAILYLKGSNLLNEEARNHVSFLKDRAPLAGRSIMLGIKNIF